MPEVLRTGLWFYDDAVEGRVRILKVRGTALTEEADAVKGDHPPTDVNGFYYVAEFSLPPLGPLNNGSTSWGHATLKEAVAYAEQKIAKTIMWTDK